MRYLLERVSTGEPLNTENGALYEPLRQQCPEVVACVEEMSNIIECAYGSGLTDEEKVYLTMHVNRMCAEKIACKFE